MGQRLIINNYTPFSSICEVRDLRDKIKDYYEKHYNSSKNKQNFFNLACLNAASGISPIMKDSIKYIEGITGETYNNSDVDRNDGLIAFITDEINEYLNWAEGIVDIYWSFNEDGTPDFNNTLFNIPSMVWSSREDDLKEYLDDNEIEYIKNKPKNIQLTNIPITKAHLNLTYEIPNIWYDKDLELFFEVIE